MELVDTHCHIHDSEFAKKYDVSIDDIVENAREVGVNTLVCVGTDVRSSREAVIFCRSYDDCYASLALHPHEAADMQDSAINEVVHELRGLYDPKAPIVAIGECGLDYFYHQSDEVKKRQQKLFRSHIELALELDLPLIFHIRDAFDDFFTIIDEYPSVSGVVHSFSAHDKQLQGVIERGFYVGLNGIMTFTKDQKQLEAAKNVPLEKLVLETDAPFLTPKPFRGTMCEPKHVINITQFLSELRGESQALLAKQTTKNAKTLFNL